MKPRAAIVLSGCGVRDGAEINETVMTALCLEQRGAEIIYTAPDMVQNRVINHLTGKSQQEERNVLVESARIARGRILSLDALKADEIDVLVFPGGSGVSVNLSNFSSTKADCVVHPSVENLIKEMHRLKKPMGFLCLAPILAACVIKNNVEVTVGDDAFLAEAIQQMGGVHIERTVYQTHVDSTNKIVSTPAYMLAETTNEAFAGIKRLADDLLEMI